MVMFAFRGVELLGVTAGEVEDPAKSLPKATNAVVWRILVFYIGALLVVMSLVPWTDFSAGESPFVMVFERMGLPAAALVINFVVITAAASSCNSASSPPAGCSTPRPLRPGAEGRRQVSKNHVPALGITVSVAVMLLGVVLHYFIPEQVFVYVTSVALVGTLWTWGMIMLAHIGYRRAVARGEAAPVSFPHARRSVHQLGRARLPRHGRDLPRLRQRHPRRPLRRPGGSPSSASATRSAAAARRRRRLTPLTRRGRPAISPGDCTD